MAKLLPVNTEYTIAAKGETLMGDGISCFPDTTNENRSGYPRWHNGSEPYIPMLHSLEKGSCDAEKCRFYVGNIRMVYQLRRS